MEDELLTMDELCKLLKLSRATINRWRKEGLPTKKIGKSVRFEKDMVFKWLDENKSEK